MGRLKRHCTKSLQVNTLLMLVVMETRLGGERVRGVLLYMIFLYSLPEMIT